MKKTDFNSKVQQIADKLGWQFREIPKKYSFDEPVCIIFDGDGHKLHLKKWIHYIKVRPILPSSTGGEESSLYSLKASVDQIATAIKEEILPDYFREFQADKEKIEKERKAREEQRENANKLAVAMGLSASDVYEVKETKEMILCKGRVKAAVKSDGAVTIEIALNNTDAAVRILKRLL